ncbi:unnamed protein product [Hapterophycus canaliculatus]
MPRWFLSYGFWGGEGGIASWRIDANSALPRPSWALPVFTRGVWFRDFIRRVLIEQTGSTSHVSLVHYSRTRKDIACMISYKQNITCTVRDDVHAVRWAYTVVTLRRRFNSRIVWDQ